jgi:hypothetical protein
LIASGAAWSASDASAFSGFIEIELGCVYKRQRFQLAFAILSIKHASTPIRLRYQLACTESTDILRILWRLNVHIHD